ncbi:MAG: pilus assembly protein [Propionibacteriaceae bacterium]|nr:pilus assembly protein [Propionibacteriaceae bacterium]
MGLPRRRCGGRQGERGAIGSVQAVVVLPLAMTCFMATVQASLYFYGRSAAIAVAHTGAVAAATENGNLSGCEAASADLAIRIGDALQEIHVSCRLNPTTATVVVTGQILSVVPGWYPTVTQTAEVPVERVT